MTKQWMILAENPSDKETANRLMENIPSDINFILTDDRAKAQDSGLYLRMDESGLTLTDGKLEMTGELTRLLPRLKRNNLLQEMLVKAAKIKGAGDGLKLIDATAGMGEDSLILAAAGFEVNLYEYDPVIAILLADSLRRGSRIPELADAVSRMHLHIEDSVHALHQMADLPEEERPAVILLDPMFPERNKSGLIKKKFQLLQQLESPCSNEEDLLQAAKAAHPRKIVIKRPAKGPNLAGVKPSYSLPGKAIRYDCILL